MVSLGVLFWKIHSHPLNLFILAVFTLFESMAVGTVVGFYETIVVIQALCITLAVFVGLTLFTMQTKYDFDGLGPWLCEFSLPMRFVRLVVEADKIVWRFVGLQSLAS